MAINNSPFENCAYLQYDNGDISMEREPYTYYANANDKVHTVLGGETIWSIAFQYYQDSGLWYVIADANDIVDPISEIIEGVELIIPSNIQ